MVVTTGLMTDGFSSPAARHSTTAASPTVDRVGPKAPRGGPSPRVGAIRCAFGALRFLSFCRQGVLIEGGRSVGPTHVSRAGRRGRKGLVLFHRIRTVSPFSSRQAA